MAPSFTRFRGAPNMIGGLTVGVLGESLSSLLYTSSVNIDERSDMQAGARAIAATRDHEVINLRKAKLILLALLAWWVALSVSLSAQDTTFKVLPLNPEFDTRPDPDTGRVDSAKRAAFGERAQLVNDIFTGRASLDDNRIAFDQWFQEVIFPLMAQDTDAELAEMANQRETMFASLERATNQPALEHFARDLALPTFRDIANDSYHPAVRLNAATIVGRLDRVVGRRRDIAPEPLPEALPVLLQWFEDGALPPYVRIAALFGLDRHAAIDGQKQAGRWDDATRLRFHTALLPVLAAAPEGTSAEADYWMKRLACRALGSARSVGNNAEVATALRAVLADESLPLSVRCEAAIAYGKLQFANPADSQAKEVAIEVARLAVAAAQDELVALEAAEDHVKLVSQFRTAAPAGAMPGMAGIMGAGGPGAMPLPGGPTGVSGPGGASGASGEEGAAGGPSSGPGGRPASRGPGGGSGGGSSAASGGSGSAMPGIFGNPAGGGSSVDLPAYQFRLSQRRLMSTLYQLQMSMKTEGSSPMGLTTHANADPLVAQIAKGISELMTSAQVGISDRETLDLEKALDDFKSDVRDKADDLEQLLPAPAVDDSTGGDAGGADGDDPFPGN